jgi:ketosteroid isomerase-like protein
VGPVTDIGAAVGAVRTPEELYELLDPDVMWYSADVNSNYTCNDRDDAIACVERNVVAGMTGRFEVVGADEDSVVVQPVLDPPRESAQCLLLRFRDGLIVEMRDFASSDAARAYAGMA